MGGSECLVRIGVGTMADRALKQKIKDVLRKTYFDDPDDAVYVSDSEEGEEDIYVVVISPKFAGKRLQEKNDLILSLLVGSLPSEEWGRVTLSVGHSPDELTTV
jgi:stress-induced morphogen